MYMPKFDEVNKDFMRDVLANRKKLLSMEEVRAVNVPSYDELSVRNMWEEVLEDPDIA